MLLGLKLIPIISVFSTRIVSIRAFSGADKMATCSCDQKNTEYSIAFVTIGNADEAAQLAE